MDALASLIDRATTALQERLTETEYEHSLGVAATARMLASIYEYDDEDDAYLAGLLHDWDKCRSNEELLADAEEYGIEITDIIKANPRLLHAHTGARAVSHTFPRLAPEIIEAIENHTIGAVPMTDLDRIVYIADMIEPARDQEGVGDLRGLVGIADLDTLFFRCYQRSLEGLVVRCKVIHPDTAKVWNWLLATFDAHE